MRSLATALIVAAVTAAAWLDRRQLVAALEDEWTAFLREIGA